MTKNFASTGDLEEKKITFKEIGPQLFAFTAQGDPNSGIIVGDDGVIVIDAQATPVLAAQVIERVRKVTDKPIKYVVLSHYHAVRVLGASAYNAQEIIASETCRAMIAERGQEDWDSEYGRFPRLFRAAESMPGLTWPTVTFKQRMTLYLGKRRVELMHLGRAHTAGDIVAYVPDANVVFSGDIVEYKSACYCGDAHFTDWPGDTRSASAFGSEALVPGRGDALVGQTPCGRASRSRGNSWAISTPRSSAAWRAAPRSRTASTKRRRPCAPSTATGRSSSTASRSMSRGPTTRRRASTPRASGPRNATAPCGRRCRGEALISPCRPSRPKP